MNDLDSWQRTPCEGGVVWRAPSNAWIRIRPRCRAPRLGIVESIVDSAVGARDVELVPFTELVTSEGESAVIGGARFSIDGVPRELAVAIAGDVPFLCIDGVGAPMEVVPRVTSLISRLGLGLGRMRHRWFQYRGPQHWIGIPRVASTVWLHPEYPRTQTRITVFDARPFTDSDGERLDRFLFLRMDDDIERTAPDEIESLDVPGLEGRLRITRGRVGGAHVIRAAAALADDAFTYFAHCEAPEEDLAPFRALLHSILPVPRAEDAQDLTAIWNDET